MPMYARLMRDVHGTENWIIHAGNIAHPLIVLTRKELRDFVYDASRQDELDAERIRREEEQLETAPVRPKKRTK